MNDLDVSRFFNTLLTEAIAFPERAAMFRGLAFDANEWPDIPARKLMLEFDAATKQRGEDYARVLMTSKLQNLETYDALPEEQGELVVRYERAATYGLARQLAERIRLNPLDVEQIIDDFKRKRPNRVNTIMLGEAIDQVLEQTQKDIEKDEVRVLIPGWEKLSRKIGGFNPGRISLLVAESGVGKTMLAGNLASAASQHMGVMFFNMEMSIKDFTSRFILGGAKMKSEDWYSGKWNFPAIGEYRERVAKSKPVIITDGRALTLNQIIGQIIMAREKHGVQFVVVDYDQKIRNSGRGEEWQLVLRAIEELEECAKANNVHIMVLAQGDDDGKIKSSGRAKQPASTIFEFYETNGKYGIRSKKNRHGARRWSMKVHADPSMSLVSEGEVEDDQQLPLKENEEKHWWNSEREEPST